MNMQTITQFKKMLLNIQVCMKKAAAHADQKKYDVNLLATYRLAPDMFAFNRQIQSACDAAKFCAAYLSEQTAPKHEDTETTWAELNQRIDKVVAYLDGFKPEDFSNAKNVKVKPAWAKGQWIAAEDYTNQIAIPNFYFHAMAAYAILRSAGVEVGKLDYLGAIELKD